jgi:hypothetical protein
MLGLSVLLALVSTGAVASGSHCNNQEQVVFSCTIAKSSKLVSLCASKSLSKKRGNLVYRFGTTGQVELEFPSSPINSVDEFRFSHYFRYRTDRTEVSFTNGTFRYSIFDDYEEDENPRSTRGVNVSREDGEGAETELLCGSQVTSNLKILEGVVPCDTDSALASCNW